MNLLGLDEGYWSVIGLGADILGFCLLSVDLLPEYLEHKARNTLDRVQVLFEEKRSEYREKRRALGQLSPSALEQSYQWDFLDDISSEIVGAGVPIDGADRIMQALDEASRRIVQVRWLIGKGRVRFFEGFRQPDVIGRLRVGGAKVDPLVGKYAEVLHDHSEMKIAYDTRRRIPISVGISLVIVGFALQLIGTIPV